MNTIFIVRKHKTSSYYWSGYHETFVIHGAYVTKEAATQEAKSKNQKSNKYFYTVQKVNVL